MIRKLFIGFFIFTLSYSTYGQNKEGLVSQQVTVEKSYTPSLSNINKLPTNPVLEDTLFGLREKIEYITTSKPLLFNFEPQKGDPIAYSGSNKTQNYNSFLRVGYGTSQQANGDLYSGFKIKKKHIAGIGLNYFGRFANIPALLDNTTQDYKGAFFLNTNSNKVKTVTNLSYRGQELFLYGTPYTEKDLVLLESHIPSQEYSEINGNILVEFKSNIRRKNVFLKNIEVSNSTFFAKNNYSYYESHIQAKTVIELPFLAKIKVAPSVDYFDSSLSLNTKGILGKVGVFIHNNKLLTKRFAYTIGFDGYYINSENSSEKFNYIYPNASVSFSNRKGNFRGFLNIDGNVDRTMFNRFYKENPYLLINNNLSDTYLRFTETPYQFNAGITTLISKNIETTIGGRYSKTTNAPFFKRKKYSLVLHTVSTIPIENSFGIVYDNLTKYDINTQITFLLGKKDYTELYFQYNIYEVENELRPWNLPLIQASWKGNFTLKKWVLQWDAMYWGMRYANDVLKTNTETHKEIPEFINIDLTLSNQVTKNIYLFVEGKNLLNNTMGQWDYYPILGANVVGGIIYKWK